MPNAHTADGLSQRYQADNESQLLKGQEHENGGLFGQQPDPYAIREMEIKSGKRRIKKSMKKVIGWDKIDFNLKTIGIIKMYLCCRLVRSRKALRYMSPSTRQSLFFFQGR